MATKPTQRKYAKHRAGLSAQAELDELLVLAGQLEMIGPMPTLRRAGALPLAGKFKSFLKSLDGAIRHRQGLVMREAGL